MKSGGSRCYKEEFVNSNNHPSSVLCNDLTLKIEKLESKGRSLKSLVRGIWRKIIRNT
jgi:hypothetical protein